MTDATALIKYDLLVVDTNTAIESSIAVHPDGKYYRVADVIIALAQVTGSSTTMEMVERVQR